MPKRVLFLEVTNDAYELPLCSVDSMEQLTKERHVSEKTVFQNIRLDKKNELGDKRRKFVSIPISKDDWREIQDYEEAQEKLRSKSNNRKSD